MQLTDVSVLRDLCARYGFSMSKGLGQNFIVNPGVCPKLAGGTGIDKTWGVLEIGPGFGVLTQELARRAAKVVTVEVDPRLPAVLAETLAEFNNVKIVQGDVLKLDLAKLVQQEFGTMPVAVCANLPYYITSPILMSLLESRLPVENITVMVQREAAQRICAQPPAREAGAVSYAVHYFATAEILFTVQPGSFFPPPKVTSSIIRLTPRKAENADAAAEAALFRVIRAAFGQRRKTAVNAISAGLGVEKQRVADAFAALAISPTARPEQLSLAQFADISREIFA